MSDEVKLLPALASPPRFEPRIFASTVRFEADGPFARSIIEDAISFQKQINEWWAASLYDRPPAPAPPPLPKWRTDLARRLYNLAIRLDPDLEPW